jgi:hypothetical protein
MLYQMIPKSIKNKTGTLYNNKIDRLVFVDKIYESLFRRKK